MYIHIQIHIPQLGVCIYIYTYPNLGMIFRGYTVLPIYKPSSTLKYNYQPTSIDQLFPLYTVVVPDMNDNES